MHAVRFVDLPAARLTPAAAIVLFAALWTNTAKITLGAEVSPPPADSVTTSPAKSAATNSLARTPAGDATSKSLASKPFRLIQDDVRAALRRESESKTVADRTRAVYELIELHRAIVADERFRTGDTMKGFRQQIASRLLAVAGEIQRKLYRERSEKPAKPVPTARVVGRRAPSGGGDDLASLADGPLPPTDAVSDSWTDLLSLAGASQGGPLRVVLEGGASTGRPGGPAVIGDWGPALVDLIQRTIHPDFWDVHGGPGTIVYYAPLHCLVVRATAEVHGDVGAVIGGLRRVRP